MTEPTRTKIAELYVAHGRDIFRYLRGRFISDPQHAQDIMHQTFLHVCLHPEKLQTVREPKGWLIHVASNLAIDELRASRRRNALHEKASDISGAGDQSFLCAWFSEHVEKLSEPEKTIARNRWLEGWSLQRLAAEEHVSLGGISNILARIVEKLRIEKRL